MNWIAPPEKDASNDALKKRLWAVADQLRANCGLIGQVREFESVIAKNAAIILET
jgi:hypothetical protein